MDISKIKNQDIFKLAGKVPNLKVKHKMLDQFFEWFIPFNKDLGLRIQELDENQVKIKSLPKKRRRNHLGGAHACALALVGEYPAGLVIAQNFPPHKYRIIMNKLEIEYFKQGFNVLYAEASKPDSFAEPVDHETTINMTTEIKNADGELIAICKTQWPIKEWKYVKKKTEDA
ncbi:MAG: DUF4442 domain-containing protein [Bdellovibrionaceae bacterium]|nr:DUF4442 domain-containing protein [Pseudobdellovibrionaceae bacterium]